MLPLIAFIGQDIALSRHFWPLDTGNARYAYQGTLINRVACLDAWLNASPAAQKSPDESAAVPPGLAESLSAFLPVPDFSTESACAFSLYPGQYSAEYPYLSIEYASDNARLSVITDQETGLPLRIEFSFPPDMLRSWLDAGGHTPWDILHGYAALLQLGDPTDGATNISTILHSQSAQLRGTSYCATVTVIPSAGTLLLKLTASAP